MKSALVIIDMQNDFVHGVLGSGAAKAIIPAIQDKLAAYRRAGEPVYFTMDTHEPGAAGVEAEKIPPHCMRGTPGWRIIPELDTGNAPCVEKPAFMSLIWDAVIGEDVSTIELCGVCTDICVVSNALFLRAQYPEARIVVNAGCCAGTSVENHKAALAVMRSCLIDIVG
ncbi:MAG: cysteine hydrolase [Oscillospiraceae bacterium]|jgi:nicotinamidase-related amidase|nr:cysteine hydrolase [Oscillospiraceae bacterium]